MFTARYEPSPYIKQIRFVFKGLNLPRNIDQFQNGGALSLILDAQTHGLAHSRRHTYKTSC
jgi:hypothetical protein